MPIPYSKACLEIRKIEHLSLRIKIPLKDLQEIAKSIDQHYQVWQVPKKNGGFRTISAPKPHLKKIQSKIHSLLAEIIIDDAAHCGIKGRSNLSNAECHVKQKWLLNLDFSKFFPSTSHHKVYRMFLNDLKCSPDVASLLTRLCTYKYEVPQGAPMSMDIANLVSRQIDRRLSGLALKYGITYTRYCDDLSFSGPVITVSFIRLVKKIIAENGFKLNEKKEFLGTNHHSKIVTGLSVNTSRPKLPRSKLRRWRVEEYIFNKFETSTLPESLLVKRKQQIVGRIAYKNFIDKGHTNV